MTASMRAGTLETLDLGTVFDVFRKGRLPANAPELVDQVFGKEGERGCLVVSGANGIVGAGKTMQLASRLEPFGVPVVALDFAGAPDGLGRQHPGLVRTFGRERASRIMENTVRLSYDGKRLPAQLKGLRPRFLLEAIPEILEAKRAHYEVFRQAFPGIEIRSVTSGFPSSKLGVGIAHPAFPHEVNKVWEVVEEEPSAVTQLLWALGLTPIPVSDHWSFVLDVLFCGTTLAALRIHQASNMPYWKIDKHVRSLLGPNPLRAHDVIGAKGADFLTWSCLHHLSREYGALFEPTPDLEERKDTGQEWYPPKHLRPLVDWPPQESELSEFRTRLLGPLFQMTALLLHERRSHLSHINSIGELCAQFRRGVLSMIRGLGRETALEIVRDYHRLHPQAKGAGGWHPGAFGDMDSPSWRQLYVNAEHDGKVGIVSIGRERYNGDVDAELNRAIDWLQGAKIERVIVSGDFHLSGQMVGADIADFFPALESAEEGLRLSTAWSRTARRLNDDFRVSVGFVGGKRCLGGSLELLMHCHYLVARSEAELGMPEVTLPVVPGMEGCHWPFRKASPDQWPRLLDLLLTGSPVRAGAATGWLVDYAGPLEDALAAAWQIATEGRRGLARRKLRAGGLKGMRLTDGGGHGPGGPAVLAARKAILDCVRESCAKPLPEALLVQARLCADFMGSDLCRKGGIGAERAKATA
ncbi:MAG: hypothetical protein HY748_02085 [Elusimicrobia bacterium]|nr:hypothetical protein [Elusimicrobiota bacterium]